MRNFCANCFRVISIAAFPLLIVGLSDAIANAQTHLYKPIPLQVGNPVQDTLSAQDIPTGQGGFARDYVVNLSAEDRVMISVSSSSFDTFVALLAADGSPVGDNDDSPEGGTDSRLVAKITDSGDYIVRVRASGGTKGDGTFTLKVTHQRPES